MGLFKKKDKGDKSGAPQGNPYAQPPQNPYQQAKQQAYDLGRGDSVASHRTAPPPYSDKQDNDRYDEEKKHPQGNGYAQQDRYGGTPRQDGTPQRGGYGANPYGAQSGYGNDKYGASSSQQQGPSQRGGSRYGAGGYGGMGGQDPYAEKDDDNRAALFGSQKPQQSTPDAGRAAYGANPSAAPPRNPYDPANPTEGGSFNAAGTDYTPGPQYEDRQLTAEEEEEQEVGASKQQIREMKQQDVASTRNALRIANRAEEIGRDTLARLGAQGEAIHNTEKNLDLSHNHNKVAEDRARELKTLNRSMFAVHVANPFTSKSRQAHADARVMDRHLEERDQREESRRAAYLSDQRMQKNFADVGKPDQDAAAKKERNLAERAKYQFEADSEDEDMENEIDANLDALSGATSRLNMLAKATGKEVEAQNEHLSRIADKSDRVDLALAANHARINRIK